MLKTKGSVAVLVIAGLALFSAGQYYWFRLVEPGRNKKLAEQSSVAITNSFCTANSIVHATIAGMDTTAKSCIIQPLGGYFNAYLNASATAEVPINFTITNV